MKQTSAIRVTFEVASAQQYPGTDYDLVAFFDCLHDMGDPTGAAAHVLHSLKPDGSWMIVEPFAHDRLEDNLNPVGRVVLLGVHDDLHGSIIVAGGQKRVGCSSRRSTAQGSSARVALRASGAQRRRRSIWFFWRRPERRRQLWTAALMDGRGPQTHLLLWLAQPDPPQSCDGQSGSPAAFRIATAVSQYN
jgi:hypothetical protein